ncbi:hypothetical protein QNE27_004685 [Vibrio alginolyticus]|uniref:hypothetical protein n=1 Tax=unclassified Vibrio TaxID=2614977 RepID=UPI00188082E4|nr:MULTISPECIES: hypothetical protein [unclassified Vibrio]EJX2557651.1 hypothetical protein [Vibrio alginolyticus]ELA6794795.1 hypothetical protein [Vibrio alginolyticus]ELA8378514.1 hypothetical protein [Vibrio alginolyticus]ELB2817768.1 hypothetical protein [Vibrio alginolyticus]MBE8569556.1 hypothetical protein [Vibrio sp. OPT46]
MEFYRDLFTSVGWFIPSNSTMGYISTIAKEIESTEKPNIEPFLEELYSSLNQAAMVTERYPAVPYICEYKDIIAGSIEAHFLGLNYAAVTTLMPVVEGVGNKLVDEWGVERKFWNGKRMVTKGTRVLFSDLAKKCREHVISNELGMVSEIVPALEAFEHYLKNNFYISSTKYAFEDKTNRHGILHGSFKDSDYGVPMNFYKTIGAVEFLCFIISLKEPISFFAPSPTDKSYQLASYYDSCKTNSLVRRKIFG